MKKLTIVVPCYNNEENIPGLQAALIDLSAVLTNYELEVVLVNDGSRDNTQQQLENFSAEVPFKTIVVKLTGNFGSYNAFLAGLHHGSGDVYAQVHADIQDPPKHLAEMIPYWENGIPFVIGQRVDREDKGPELFFARLYHRLMKKYALPHIPEGGYDLILFDKKLRDHVVHMNEGHTNLVYLISWLKYPYATVPVTRVRREKGRSQWTLAKKIKLIMDSLVSFSYAPIQLITFCFFAFFMLSVPAMIYLLLFSGLTLLNRFYLLLILIFANMVLLALSIIGEYAWRALEFSRKRPPFIVEKVSGNFLNDQNP